MTHTGYTTVARNKKITVSSDSANVTYADAVKMLYKTLTSTYNDITAINDAKGTTYRDSEERYVWLAFKLKLAEGVVTATEYGNINSYDLAEKNTVIIDGVSYGIAGDIDVSDLLACNVEFFYTDNDDRSIVHIKDITEDEEAFDIDAYSSYGDNKIYYYKNQKKVSIGLDPLHTIVYNGMPLRSNIKSTMENLNKGRIIVRDSNLDGKLDVIDVKDYKNYYVSTVDGEKIYNKLITGEYIDLSLAEGLKIIKDGENAGISDITTNMSLSVAKAANNKMVEIYINDVISGNITEMADTSASIEGIKYEIDKSYINELKSSVELGNSYEFSIDFLGNITYARTAEARRMTLGYIIDFAVEGLFDKEVKFLLMKNDNSKSEFKLADRIKIDAVEYSSGNADNIINVLKNGKSHARQLIQYELDADGNIKEIDTIVKNSGEDPEYSLTPVFEEVKKRNYYQNRYGRVALCSDSLTLAFCIPDDGSTDPDKYYVGKGVQTITGNNDSYVALDCYYAGENRKFVDAVVNEMPVDNLSPNTVIMVDHWSKELDKDGNLVYSIEGYTSGQKRVLTINDDVEGVSELNNVRRGDIVVLDQNKIKQISRVRKVFDAQTKTTIGWKVETDEYIVLETGTSSDKPFNKGLNLTYGYVYKKVDGAVDAVKNPSVNTTVYERLRTDSKPNMLYDSETDRIELIEQDGIVDYQTAGEDCMRVIHHQKWEENTGVFLFK